MRRDYIVILLMLGCTVVSVLLFIRKKDIIEAFFAVIVAQTFTWPLGLLFTAWGKVEYPVRLFPNAIKSSFLHGYIINPIIFAIYYIHYPKRAKLPWRLVYTLLITAIPMSIEFLENKYTNLFKYKDWLPYYSWLLNIVIYFIVRKYINWFFKNTQKRGV